MLAASDEMAIGVLLAARRLGLRVPEDLSVIGVDDHELAFTHDLTTVRQPVGELGASAAGLLVDHLRTPRSGGPRAVVTLPTELVVRGSTGAPRARSAVELLRLARADQPGERGARGRRPSVVDRRAAARRAPGRRGYTARRCASRASRWASAATRPRSTSRCHGSSPTARDAVADGLQRRQLAGRLLLHEPAQVGPDRRPAPRPT